jgi:hypothetical protein
MEERCAHCSHAVGPTAGSRRRLIPVREEILIDLWVLCAKTTLSALETRLPS